MSSAVTTWNLHDNGGVGSGGAAALTIRKGSRWAPTGQRQCRDEGVEGVGSLLFGVKPIRLRVGRKRKICPGSPALQGSSTGGRRFAPRACSRATRLDGGRTCMDEEAWALIGDWVPG